MLPPLRGLNINFYFSHAFAWQAFPNHSLSLLSFFYSVFPQKKFDFLIMS